MVIYMKFKENLKKYTDDFNKYLEKYKFNKNCLEARLYESMEYSLFSSGKRIRPVLMMAVCDMFNKDVQDCIPYAVGLEMIHNFSLIHDDLPGIDNDEFRHFKPTNHIAYGEATAILAGDSLLNMAYKIMIDDVQNEPNKENINKKLRALNCIVTSVSQMIVGEYLDTVNEGKNIEKSELDYIHKNKTGALIEAALICAGILCSLTDSDLENLKKYAKNVGLAFQIRDDILSEFGDETKTGKPVGNDKKMKKCTYVTIYGVNKSKEILNDLINDAKESLSIYGDKAEFLKNIADYIGDREN